MRGVWLKLITYWLSLYVLLSSSLLALPDKIGDLDEDGVAQGLTLLQGGQLIPGIKIE